MSLTVPQTDLDLQILLQDKLQMTPKDFESKFEVEQVGGKLVLSIRKDSNGKFVWVETHLWTVVNDYVRVLGGSYFKDERKREIPVKKDGNTASTDVPKEVEPYEGMRQRIEKKREAPKEGPIPLKPDAHERMENNLKNIHEAGEKLSYKTEWYDSLVTWIHYRIEGHELDTIQAKHEIGLEIKKSLGKFKRAEWGTKTIAHLAEDIGWSRSEIYHCLKFVTSYPNYEDFQKELSTMVDKPISWHNIKEKILYKSRKEHGQQPEFISIPTTVENLKQDFYMTNVWTLPESRPDGYGSADFRGNCDPTIIDQCLRRYLNPFSAQTVLDPMAGSGTFLDVVRRLNETIPNDKQLIPKAYDLTPKRTGIDPADAEKLATIENETVHLLFCHYPYWTMWKYSDDPNDLSNMPYDGNDELTFIKKLKRIFGEFQRILKKGGYLCILIGNKREQGIIDIEADVSTIGQEFFKLWDKIIVTGTDPACHAHTAHGQWGVVSHRALKGKWTIQNYDVLLVFRKEKE